MSLEDFSISFSIKSQITEVYDSVRKIEPVISTLPNIVDRLTALKVLHEQGSVIVVLEPLSVTRYFDDVTWCCHDVTWCCDDNT